MTCKCHHDRWQRNPLCKDKALKWNFRIQFYDLQRGPPSYLQRSSLFRFNLCVIETRATDLGYSLSRFSNGEEKEAPVMLITELKRSFCLLNPICFTYPCRRRRAVCQRCRGWGLLGWTRCPPSRSIPIPCRMLSSISFSYNPSFYYYH